MSIGFALTFYPELHLLAHSLRSFKDDPKLNQNKLSKSVGIGVLKAKSSILWLGMLGLRDNKKRELTHLGKLLLTHDAYFEDIITQWLLHYQLATNKDAEVWYLLTNEFLPYHSTFSYDDCLSFLISKGIRSKDDKHLRADVSIFLRSFVKKNSLEKIEFIKVEGELNRNIAKNKFYKNLDLNISPYLIAYVIFDQRVQKFPNFATITIEELLTRDGNVGKVLSLNRKKLEEILKLLSGTQYGQLVDLSTRAGLDQVGLRFRADPLEILRMYYSKEK